MMIEIKGCNNYDMGLGVKLFFFQNRISAKLLETFRGDEAGFLGRSFSPVLTFLTWQNSMLEDRKKNSLSLKLPGKPSVPFF